MLRSFLIGLVAGQRGLTPLAVIAAGARNDTLPKSAPLADFMARPVVAGGAIALAAAEMAGDKMKSAPDRIAPAGLIVRSITAAYSGAALAPAGKRIHGGALAVVTALAASYVGWRLRCASMRHYSQTATGAVEDAAVLGSGLAIALNRG